MELEFDKEMDAILRRGRDNRGVFVGADPSGAKHIDADQVAAFVENALPAKARTLYMEHFADCDRCRRILSQSMLFASDIAVEDVPVVSGLATEMIVPWYQKLFKTPNLAIAMGALILVFSGFFAFTVLQNRRTDQNASVAQITESERQNDVPFTSQATANSSAANVTAAPATSNLASNAALPAAGAVPNQTAPHEVLTSDGRAITLSKPDDVITGARPDSGVTTRDEANLAEESRPAAKAAPAPPAILGGTIANERESKKETDDKLINADNASNADSVKRKQVELPRGLDLPPASSKSGPARAESLNIQLDGVQNRVFDMQVPRSVGGKSFNNRNGAWYDSAYKNQATSNFRRGTPEYKNLDGGLKNIADTLGGTVVVVWKNKVYRIQ